MTMIWDIDFAWLLMAIGAVSAFAYMLSLMLESSLGGETMGPFVNAALITGGFFLGIAGANYYGIVISELKLALIVGLLGSFAMFFSVLLVRGIWARF